MRESSHSQLMTQARPDPQPTPDGCPLSPRFIGHPGWLHLKGTRLEHPETDIVVRPLDLDCFAEQALGTFQHSTQFDRL
jgi:hypothetical protein